MHPELARVPSHRDLGQRWALSCHLWTDRTLSEIPRGLTTIVRRVAEYCAVCQVMHGNRPAPTPPNYPPPMTKPQSGFIVIADITGYTSYLSESELEHAQEILQSLLELLIDHTKPPLVITRLAGDAVISYAVESRPVQGQAFIEMIEDTYVAFRRAINQMVLNTTCECNACANINALDLKFFVHHGTFSIQKLSTHEELVGHDVNTIFRMTKNEVKERTGIGAYTLYSDAAITELKLPGFSDGLTDHVQEYDDVGELAAWVQDMHPVWESKQDAARATIAQEDVVFRHESEFSVPPEVLWDYLSRPEYRSMIIRVDSQDVRNRQGGRVGTGTVFECFHGNRKPTTQTVLEWHPFDLIVSQDTTPFPGTTVISQTELARMPDGSTALTQTISKARGPLAWRTLTNGFKFLLPKYFNQGAAAVKEQIEKDLEDGTIVIPDSTAVTPSDIADAAAESLTPGT